MFRVSLESKYYLSAMQLSRTLQQSKSLFQRINTACFFKKNKQASTYKTKLPFHWELTLLLGANPIGGAYSVQPHRVHAHCCFENCKLCVLLGIREFGLLFEVLWSNPVFKSFAAVAQNQATTHTYTAMETALRVTFSATLIDISPHVFLHPDSAGRCLK